MTADNRDYSGPTALLLDCYLPLPETLGHMEAIYPGYIELKSPLGLRSDFVEMRAPFPFYLARLSDAKGTMVGELATGRTMCPADLLSDLCHALADGTAVLEILLPTSSPRTMPPNACLIGSAGRGSFGLLYCNNTPFLRRLQAAVDEEALYLERATPLKPNSAT